MSNKRGLAFVLSAPAGTGKTTLVKRLTAEMPNVVQSVSYTTRAPRPGEVPGKDYRFISLSEFKKMIDAGAFLDYVKLYGDYYGTARDKVEELLNKGLHVMLVIDTQGGLHLKKVNFKASYIFLKPPSLEELKKRLSGRSTETNSVIEERLACAERELKEGLQYDHQVLNDDLEQALKSVKSIIIAAEKAAGRAT